MKHQDYYYFNNFDLVAKAQYEANVERYRDNKTDHRSLLGACYAARQAILPTLQPLRIGHGKKVLFNPDMDTIYFGPSSYVRWWSHSANQYLLEGRRLDLEAIEQGQRPDITNFGSFNRSLHPNSFKHTTGLHHTNGLHPLMVNRMLWEERSKIRNVAIEHEFWRETESHDYLIRLLHRFSRARNFVLAVGDVGESGKKSVLEGYRSLVHWRDLYRVGDIVVRIWQTDTKTKLSKISIYTK